MATWLTTHKMRPELRARIEASVSGRARSRGHRLAPRQVMSLRLVLLVASVAALFWLGITKRQVDRELESARVSLLSRWKEASGALDERSRTLTPRVQSWLVRMTGAYPGDVVDKEVRGARLDSVLGRPIVYLRGPLADLRTTSGARASAHESVKDAFVLCLLDPPRERSEKTVLSRVRAAYGASERMRQATEHVERLGAAFEGLPTLLPSFRDGIAEADDRFELRRYERAFDAAPLESAKRALSASLLLVLIDEAGKPNSLTELDGERPHAVRVGLVDLTRDRVLLRLRREVDPTWLSSARRPEYARGADSCTLALDVRNAVRDS